MKRFISLLIIVSLASSICVSAQGFGSMPTTPFRSTSTMVGSGSSLPVAARSGVVVTGNRVGTYASASSVSSSRPRRAKKENPFAEEGGGSASTVENTGTGDPMDPGVPLGDAVLPLTLIALVFGAGVAVRNRRKRCLEGV